jgi:hypothetical protein
MVGIARKNRAVVEEEGSGVAIGGFLQKLIGRAEEDNVGIDQDNLVEGGSKEGEGFDRPRSEVFGREKWFEVEELNVWKSGEKKCAR